MNFSLREQAIYAFGPFRLDPVRHRLSRDGAPVSLSPRLFDTLLYLVQHAGRVVERDELVRAVWGSRVVDDGNLKQTIFALRKALQTGTSCERLIVTAPTRGYLFAAPVALEPFSRDAAPLPERQEPPVPALVRRHRGIIAIACAGAALLAAAMLWRPGAPFAPPPHSVAVLAFANLSGDPAQAYFSDGISDELIGALSRIGGLHVAARTSAFSVQARYATIADMARALNVGAVLEGSVRRDGTHIRTTADLIDARTGFSLWSRSYDRQSAGLLQTQADIAASVAAALQVTLLAADTARLSAGGTENPAAFDTYLQGVRLAEQPGGPAASLAAFTNAIALDPHFALARAHRAQALLAMANSDANADPAAVHRTLSDSLAEADRAIALAPNLGIAHLVRGAALMSVQNLPAADQEISLAHDLAPGDERVTMDYAVTQVQFGRPEEGVRVAQQAAALDPVTADTYLDLAGVLAASQRYDDALAAIRRARILGAADGAGPLERSIALERGQFEAVLPGCLAGHNWLDHFCLARAYHGLGRHAEAAAELATLHGMLGDNGAYQYAEIAAQWGQAAEAIRWLQTAYRLHDTGLVLMKSDALLAPVRNTTEYRDIERKLNFPP